MGIILVVKNNIKRELKNKGKFLVIFFMPTIIIALTVVGNFLMKPSVTIGIVNESKEQENLQLIELLKKTENLKVNTANKESIKTDLIMGKYSVTLDLKDDDIEFYSEDGYRKKEIERLVYLYKENNYNVDLKQFSPELFKESMSMSERVMALVSMCLFITTAMTASILIRDKEEGILTRFRYSPKKVSVYTLGNLIYNFLITLTQLAMAFIISGLLKIDIGMGGKEIILLGFIITFVSTSLGGFIGSAFKTEMQANIMSSVVAVISSLLGGAFIPIDKMPKAMKLISNITPTKWIVSLTSEFENSLFITLNTSLVILLFFGSIFLVLSNMLNSRKLNN